MSNYSDKIIFGKNTLEKVVSVEANDNYLEVFTEDNGVVTSQQIPNKFWLLANKPLDNKFMQLQGGLHYQYGKQFDTRKEFLKARQQYKQQDTYSIFDPREASMVNKGITYYKGLAPKDVSVLAFDIETTGLLHNDNSKVLIIANTLRKNGIIQRKSFNYDEYTNEGEMIKDWCKWVREVNPSILCGHNIISYDIPYLRYVADKFKVKLQLGRNNSELEYYKYTSKFRVDGNRDQEFSNLRCYGREIIDTYFGLQRWDIGKELESYGLKPAIKHFGLEIEDRQHYDASKIKDNYKDPIEWDKIKRYSEHDGDDALAILDKIIPTTFFVVQSVPKTFQQIILSASGSQINSMLLRSYIQNGHSIPKTSPSTIKVNGGISFGVPGIYKNVLKVDLKSAYPSQILRFKIFDKDKDPSGNFLYITNYFTQERFKIKALLKDPIDEMLVARDNSAKVFINSMYGVLNTKGLNFNNEHLAEQITSETRKVIQESIVWASGHDLDYWLAKSVLDEEEIEDET